MTNQQVVKSYHLRFQLNGIPEPLYFAVDQAESEWLQHLLQAPEHRSLPFFFFTTTDGHKVIVSLADIQLVTFGWDVELVSASEPPGPKIEIYFRDTAQPYRGLLEDPGPLETIFLASSFEVEDEPFVHFLDGEGEAVFLRSEQVVLLTYYWEEVKQNRSLVHRVKGQSPEPSPDDASLRGEWRIQVWQSERDEGWYADLEFVAEDQEQVLEVETYGPCEAKTEAAEVARKGLEAHWLNPPASPVF
jgi:hypothetical protein